MSEVPLRTLRTNKLSHLVAMDIVENIVQEGLQPGDRLPPEADMLKRYSAGRASIREGLRLLETYGVLSIRAGKLGGPVVEDVSSTDLARSLSIFFRLLGATYGDLIEARLALDPVVARLAAERDNSDVHHRLMGIIEVEEEDAQRRPHQVANLGYDFHSAITEASGNPVLGLLSRSLRSLYADHLQARGLLPANMHTLVPGLHRDIVTAILNHEPAAAERLMADLLQKFASDQARRNNSFMTERIAWTS